MNMLMEKLHAWYRIEVRQYEVGAILAWLVDETGVPRIFCLLRAMYCWPERFAKNQ